MRDNVLGGSKKSPESVTPEPTAMVPEQDFSPVASAKRDLARDLDYSDTRRELNRKYTRVSQQPTQVAAGSPMTASKSLALKYWQQQINDVKRAETERQAEVDLTRFPSAREIVQVAEAQGVTLKPEDLKTLVDWSVLNDAADTIIAGSRPEIGDPNVVTNVASSLAKTNPVSAALLGDLVKAKLEATATDPTVLENIAGGIGEAITTAMAPFMAAWQWSAEGFNAGNYAAANSGRTEFTWPNQIAGYFSPSDRAATAPGKLNEEYIQQLREATNADGTPKYSPLQIEIVTELVRRKAKGDAYPLADLWQEKYAGNLEAAQIFGDLAYGRSTGNTQELYRQVQSANLADLGQSALGAANNVDYNEFRGTELRENIADVVGFGVGVAVDPTNLAFGAGRAFQAARWALTKLAPGAGEAEKILRSMRLGGKTVGFEFNPAYRFFDNFTKDLNKYDDLKGAARAAEEAGDTKRAVSLRSDAADLRTKMARQYDEMPESLIDNFYKEMPRNADGKFDVQSAAKWIDTTNDAFLTTVGDVAPRMAQIGVDDAAKRAALLQIIDTETDVKALSKAKADLAALDTETQTALDPLQREVSDASGRVFYNQVAGSAQRKTPLVPRMSAAARLRKDAVNSIRVSQMPSKTVDQMIDRHLPSVNNADQFAEDLSTNAVALGEDVRQFRGGRLNNPISGTADSVSRLFSSLPDVGRLALSDASSTKAYYRMARAFFPKRVARLMADEWRNATPGGRRKMVNGLVRGAAAVRGMRLTDDELNAFLGKLPTVNDLATGTKLGEQYAVKVTDGVLPSERAAMAAREQLIANAEPTVVVDREALSDAELIAKSKTAARKRWEDIGQKQIVDAEANLPKNVVISDDGQPTVKLTPADRREFKNQAHARLDAETEALELADNGQFRDTVGPWDWSTSNAIVMFDKYGIVPLKWAREQLASVDAGGAGRSEQFWMWLTHGVTDTYAVDDAAFDAMYAAAETQRKAGELDAMAGSLRSLTGNGSSKGPLYVEIPWQARLSRNGTLRNPGVDGPNKKTPGRFKKHYDEIESDYTEGVLYSYKKAQEEVQAARDELAAGFPEFDAEITQAQAALERAAQGTLVPPVIPPPITPTPMGPQLSLSADANGIEHALHLDDTANYVRIPSLKEFEELRKEQSLAMQGYYYTGRGVEHVTNAMSFLTLYGLRFSLRNAIEEDGLFLFMTGDVGALAKGRQFDQAVRRATPRVVVKIVDNEPKLIFKSSLGMVANKAEWLSNRMRESGMPTWLNEMVYSSVDRNAAEAALAAKKAGDPEAYANLVVESEVSRKIGRKAFSMLSNDDRKLLRYFAESSHGQALYDEVAGGAAYLQNAAMPHFITDTDMLGGAGQGVTLARLPNPTRLQIDGYGNLKPIQVDPATGQRVLGLTAWWTQLQKTLVGDGPIGEAAVRLLNNPAKAKSEVARIIREDTEFGYKERFSRITDDLAVDEFSNAYVENVFQHFTKADGTLNEELRRRFMYVNPKTGRLEASFWREIDGEGQTFVVRMSDLEDIPLEQRPTYVFGPRFTEETRVPIVETEAALLTPTRGYAWMANQNARISRGPLFHANMVNAWRQSMPVRQNLAKAIAKGAGRDVPNAADVEMAERLTAHTAMDQAYSMTLAYVDNPANRSNLAWKARNVSRYYRATEDFWRRMKRVAANKPETFWRIALTYQLALDTGFVYQDEQGTAYFGYPGNEQLNEAIATTASVFGMDALQYMDTNPFFIGGKLSGGTPSTDPMQQVPSAFGVTAVALTGIFSAFPALYKLKGLQELTLGQYVDVTGNPVTDMLGVLTPPLMDRLRTVTDPEQFDSSMGQAAMDTLALMASQGMLDTVTINGKKIPGASIQSAAQFRQTDEYAAAQKIAVANVITRTLFQFSAPAAPQQFSNDVSKIARDLGVVGMKKLFYDRLDANTDMPNPFAAALADFWAAGMKQVKAGEEVSLESFLPFTISSHKSPAETPDEAQAALAKLRLGTDNWLKWWNDDKTQDLVKNGYYLPSLYLAPRDGTFDWNSWSLVKNDLGLKIKKSENEMIMDLLSISGEYQDSQIRMSYDELIAQQDPSTEAGRAAIKDLKAAKKADQGYNKALNPAWDVVDGQRNAPYTDANYRATLASTRSMLEYMRKRDGKLTGTAQNIDSAIQIYLYYAPMIDGISGEGSEALKKEKQAEMAGELAQVKLVDPNAGVFIDSVIENLSYKPGFPAFGVQ